MDAKQLSGYTLFVVSDTIQFAREDVAPLNDWVHTQLAGQHRFGHHQELLTA